MKGIFKAQKPSFSCHSELSHLHACASEYQLFPPKPQTKFVAEISKEEEATPSTNLVGVLGLVTP